MRSRLASDHVCFYFEFILPDMFKQAPFEKYVYRYSSYSLLNDLYITCVH